MAADSGRFEGHDPALGSDTAGVPWKGRTLTGTGFDNDDGAADAALLASLDQSDTDPSAKDVAVFQALGAARLLVPVVAVDSDMAAITLTGPNGDRALPAFSSTSSLQQWDQQARPVPVSAQRAAQAALAEECEYLVVDLAAGRAAPRFTVRPSMVRALATGSAWQPAHTDPLVRDAVEQALEPEPAVRDLELGRTGAGELLLVLHVAPGLRREQTEGLVQRVGDFLADSLEARSRVDGLSVRLVRAPA